jgi:ABC-type sugar transport system permease subunit
MTALATQTVILTMFVVILVIIGTIVFAVLVKKPIAKVTKRNYIITVLSIALIISIAVNIVALSNLASYA